MKFNQTMVVSVDGDLQVLRDKRIVCNKIDRKLTWNVVSPSGFYYQNKWKCSICKTNLKRTELSYSECLRGRHLILIGDSNCRSFAFYLQKYLGLTDHTHRKQDRAWHQDYYAERKDSNISLSWFPHESPFFSWPKFSFSQLRPPGFYLNQINRFNNSVILIHMFAHFGRAHPNLFQRRVKELRTSVENLLERAPEVTIFIKGTHASRYYRLLTPVDYTYALYQKVWYEEFQHLQDKVIYLDEWDITTGTNNENMHPAKHILEDMIHIFLSYLCNS